MGKGVGTAMPLPGEAVFPVTDTAAHSGLSRGLLLGSLQRASSRLYEPSEVGE